jgi:predicted deacetylase
VLVTTDDLCLSYLENFKYFDDLKKKYSDLKVVAFTIGNYKNKELLLESDIFKNWYQKHKDWVEIAVHSYDHDDLPDGDREDEEHWIKMALDSLKPFLPVRYGYRSPGWQTTNKTVPILKKLGFSYIAYECKIRDLKEEKIIETQVINSHLCDVHGLENLCLSFKGGEKS